MMEKTQAMYAKEYLGAKQHILAQCVALTTSVGQEIGNIPQTHILLGQRKQLLVQLNKLEQEYSPLLAGYTFAEEELAPIAALAEQMWDADDHITEAMRANKANIQDFLNEINVEVVHQQQQ